MSTVPRWYDRKFQFSFPPEQHLNLRVRLWGTPVRVEEMVRGCRSDILVRKLDGKWSAQEHVGHLLNLEDLWMQRVSDFVSGGSELSVADLSNRPTDEANYNARQLGEILSGFRQARMRLVERLRTIETALFSRTRLHPRLKQPMRLVDHLYFVAEHDDHHLAKIWELIGRT